MSIKVVCTSHDMRILGGIVGARSAEQSAGTVLTAKKAWGIIPETSE